MLNAKKKKHTLDLAVLKFFKNGNVIPVWNMS